MESSDDLHRLTAVGAAVRPVCSLSRALRLVLFISSYSLCRADQRRSCVLALPPQKTTVSTGELPWNCTFSVPGN